MKKKRKPIVAWAVVCPDSRCGLDLYSLKEDALSEASERNSGGLGIAPAQCGPHKVVKLVEQPKRRKK